MHNIWETTENWENEAISSGLVTRRLYFKKKRTLNGHFSRPADTDPYVNTVLCSLITEQSLSLLLNPKTLREKDFVPLSVDSTSTDFYFCKLKICPRLKGIKKNAESHWNVWGTLFLVQSGKKCFLYDGVRARGTRNTLRAVEVRGKYIFPVEINFPDKSARRGPLLLSITRLQHKSAPVYVSPDFRKSDLWPKKK